jgi:hypothetical protein
VWTDPTDGYPKVMLMWRMHLPIPGEVAASSASV